MVDLLVSRAAFVGFAGAGAGRGVVASDRDGLGLATVAARKGQGRALAQRVRERFCIALPSGPARMAVDGIAFAGTGEGHWLASQESGGNGFAATLARELGLLAAVTDQSDGYAVLRLTGSKLRAALVKIVPIDLHPRAFKVGDIASTVASHMGVILWRLEDDAHGASVMELAVFRSFAGSFWRALSQAAAEYGLEISSSPEEDTHARSHVAK